MEKKDISNQALDLADRLFNIKEAAERLNLKVSRIRYELFNKRIPSIRIGRSIRFSEKSLIDWINNLQNEGRKSEK